MAVTFDGSVFNENDPLISGIDMHTDALVPPRSHCGDKATAIHPGDIMEIFIWELRILIRTQGRVPTPPTLPPAHPATVGTVGIAGFSSEILFFIFPPPRRATSGDVWTSSLLSIQSFRLQKKTGN